MAKKISVFVCLYDYLCCVTFYTSACFCYQRKAGTKTCLLQHGEGMASSGVELKVPPNGETPHSYHLRDEGSEAGPLRATLRVGRTWPVF